MQVNAPVERGGKVQPRPAVNVSFTGCFTYFVCERRSCGGAFWSALNLNDDCQVCHISEKVVHTRKKKLNKGCHRKD